VPSVLPGSGVNGFHSEYGQTSLTSDEAVLMLYIAKHTTLDKTDLYTICMHTKKFCTKYNVIPAMRKRYMFIEPIC